MPIRNIIYIHTHDMGRYISPYGYAVPTPNLQRFAEEATTFRQAYCCGPTCSPSRAGLLTGVTPHQSGMLGLAHRGFRLSRPEEHLAAFLRRNGFQTALCGVQHEFEEDRNQMAYDEVHEIRHMEADLANEDHLSSQAAQGFLRQDHQQPFFLSYGLFYPHRPFVKADHSTFNPDRILPPGPLPDTPRIREDMADYHETVNLTDKHLGEVFQAIRETGHDEDSLIIVTTDHGIAFPKMKCTLSDAGIGVTLLMAYPGNPSCGKSLDALVSHLDIFPTICNLLDLEPPPYLLGKCMRPLFEGSRTSIREEVFAEINFHADYEPMRCIRTNRHKLIRRYDANLSRLRNCDASLSKQEMTDFGWAEQPRAETELYDLMMDPAESCNLAVRSEFKPLLDDLNARLNAWMQQTDDPLIH